MVWERVYEGEASLRLLERSGQKILLPVHSHAMWRKSVLDTMLSVIGIFGLRGSTFADIVTTHALSSTFATHKALNTEL